MQQSPGKPGAAVADQDEASAYAYAVSKSPGEERDRLFSRVAFARSKENPIEAAKPRGRADCTGRSSERSRHERAPPMVFARSERGAGVVTVVCRGNASRPRSEGSGHHASKTAGLKTSASGAAVSILFLAF